MPKKYTEGFVVQTYNKEGQCTSQRFVAGDIVEWEDDIGNPINEPPYHRYEPFKMVQPEEKE